MKTMALKRFYEKFNELLAANKGGGVRNLMITDTNAAFLDSALCELRSWAEDKKINLLEIDEDSSDWLECVQSRELFDKMNEPSTVLLIKNYGTLNWGMSEEYSPHAFLRDAALNRHYGCGNDWFPSDELPNLLFVVALNDLSKMYWDEAESSSFAIMFEDKMIDGTFT